MYIFILIIHVIVCLVLILVVLLQAGRGGGMTDMLGSQAQNLFGTQTNEFMVKATEISAILFIVTSLSLGVISTQRGKSLMERQRFQGASSQAKPKDTGPARVVPAASETPAKPASQPADAAPAHTEAQAPKS